MSITSEELNYLIWRYLQESGKEVTALALQEESRVLEFEGKYGEHIPVGTLVNFMQKGILYSESELMVRYDGQVTPIDENHYAKDFTLVQALAVDKERFPEISEKGRFALDNEAKPEHKEVEHMNSTSLTSSDAPDFVKTLHEELKLPVSSASQWNPTNSRLLAWGERDSVAKIAKLEFEHEHWSVLETFVCHHPSALSTTAGKTTNEVTCLQWSPSGQSLLTGVENGELRLWSEDGKLQNIFNLHRSPIISIKWNQDGIHILTSDVDNVVIVWNAITGTPLQNFEIKEDMMAESLGVDVEWVDLDKFVIPGLLGSILICEIGKNRPIAKLIGHTKTLTAFDYNSNNNTLLSASDDRTVRVWRSGSVNALNCFYGCSQSITSAYWLNEEYVIAASMDGSVRVWSHYLNALLALSMMDGVPIFCGSLSPDKKKFAVGKMDGGVTIYDIEKLLFSLSTKSSIHGPIPIPMFGDYQSNKEGNFVAGIAWSCNSSQFSVSYSLSQTSMILLG